MSEKNNLFKNFVIFISKLIKLMKKLRNQEELEYLEEYERVNLLSDAMLFKEYIEAKSKVDSYNKIFMALLVSIFISFFTGFLANVFSVSQKLNSNQWNENQKKTLFTLFVFCSLIALVFVFAGLFIIISRYKHLNKKSLLLKMVIENKKK